MDKQLVKRNRDVVGENCVEDSDGKIVMEEDRLMKVWRAHYDVLSNGVYLRWRGSDRCKFSVSD